jgi:electron transfer flavoprotein beta subunit
VWFGKQAVDDDAAQVGPMVAEMLDLPCVTVVAASSSTPRPARVEREIEGGREVVEVTLPAVLAPKRDSTSRAMPRSRASWLPRRSRSRSRRSTSRPGTRDRVAGAARRARSGRIVGQGVEGVAELVRVLREEAKVI